MKKNNDPTAPISAFSVRVVTHEPYARRLPSARPMVQIVLVSPTCWTRLGVGSQTGMPRRTPKS